MTRGFVISIDALLALFILFVMLTITFQVLDQQSSETLQRQQLQKFVFSAAQSMEKSRLLSNAVITDNTTALRNFLDSWPSNLCGSVTVFSDPLYSGMAGDEATPIVLAVSKSGCTTSLGVEESYSRGFMLPSPPDVNMYVATTHVWVNQA